MDKSKVDLINVEINQARKTRFDPKPQTLKCLDCGKTGVSLGRYDELCECCISKRKAEQERKIAESYKGVAKYQLAMRNARKTRVTFWTLVQQEMDAARKKLDSK